MTGAFVVGAVTTTGATVCLTCAADHHALADNDLGAIAAPIEDPAPHGVRLVDARNADRYDAPCAICGWPIRRPAHGLSGALERLALVERHHRHECGTGKKRSRTAAARTRAVEAVLDAATRRETAPACCERFATAGRKPYPLEGPVFDPPAADITDPPGDGWAIQGCCGGDCWVLTGMLFCPFCGARLPRRLTP